MAGVDILLEVLASQGVTHVFGNPGTTELPFMDALAGDDRFHYVLALQEATAVGAADGYAQVTGRPAFLNLHTSAGLGNAIGNLTNARANAAPLVVTAGNADRRHLAAEPMLSGDLVGLAQGTVKWGHEVRHAGELATIVRRAFHDAAAAPAGPVFVSIPVDVLDEDTSAELPAPSRIEGTAVPDAAVLLDLAGRLAAAAPDGLALVAGDEVSTAGAVEPLVELAETLGARVFGSPLHGRRVFPPLHPLWAGMLNPRADAIRAALAPYRTVFLAGGQAFRVYPYAPGSPVPDGAELLHLAPDISFVGRVHPVALGLAGDLGATLDAILPLVRERADARAATAAISSARQERMAAIERLETSALDRYGALPMEPAAATHALLRALPPETIVVDEAITTGTYVRGFHHTAGAGTYFFCKGGGLGWGMPASLGASLGAGRAPVLCVVGDGSAMYSVQALWTAARERLPVVFALVDNGQYLILKHNLKDEKRPHALEERFVGLDLDQPRIDFVALAASMGVAGTTVEKAADVGDATRAALERGEPHLLHLPIAAR